MNSISQYSLYIYWRVRPESREEVAEKLAIFLNKLAVLDDSFFSWFAVAKKKKNRIPLPTPFDKNSIAPMLKTSKTYFEKTPILDLGFSVTVWAGGKQNFRYLSANCGVYTKSVVNSVGIYFTGPEFPSMELMRDIHGLMREVFQPEAGVIRIDENIISENGEEQYEDRVLESFGAIDEDGRFIRQ